MREDRVATLSSEVNAANGCMNRNIMELIASKKINSKVVVQKSPKRKSIWRKDTLKFEKFCYLGKH